MNQLTTRLNISDVEFKFCNMVEITTSFNHLTDTAKIIVPKKLIFKDSAGNVVNDIAKGEDAIFKRGDLMDASLGYDHVTTQRFSGYLSNIKTKFPLEFLCEDGMYFLKNEAITLSMKNPKLSELMEKIVPSGVQYEVTADQNLGDFRITNATPSLILDTLRKKHGIYSFFRDDVLYIGLAVVPKLQKTVRFTMFKDIINANNLSFINDFDRKLKIVVKSILDDNTILEATAGSEDGETRTIHLYNVDNIADLQTKADALVDQLVYSGYEGSFTTFLTPAVNHGDIVEIINPQIPEQSGGYIVEKNVITSGVSGGRQKIEIKQKVYDI